MQKDTVYINNKSKYILITKFLVKKYFFLEILEDDFIICTNCNLKNPLINFNCSSCNLYFYANSSNAADLNNSQTFVVNNRKSTNSSLASSSSSTSLSSPILPTLLAQYSTSSTHSNGLTSTAGNDSPRFANNNSVF
jgi:hypothetical protein